MPTGPKGEKRPADGIGNVSKSCASRRGKRPRAFPPTTARIPATKAPVA